MPFTAGATPLSRVLGPLKPALNSLMIVEVTIVWRLAMAFCPTAVMRWMLPVVFSGLMFSPWSRK